MATPKSYKDVVFQGATFPDAPYTTFPVKLNDTITKEYLPALNTALPDAPKGLKLLITAMTSMEGFTKGSRSYRTNNPANVGNTDNGANNTFTTLADGIKAQAKFIQDIAAGNKKPYPLNKQVDIKPFYSPEIAKNQATYGISPYVAGYSFLYTGQLDQFLKIYSTGARVSNNYPNTIISYFKQNGITILPIDTLQHIISAN